MAKRQEEKTVTIDVLRRGVTTYHLLGITPLIYEAVSGKAKRELLLPRKKTASERASTLKHSPYEEYRASTYRLSGGPTVLGFPAVCFKKSLASVALDMDGVNRTQLERLVWARGDIIPMWGIPMLRMDVTRSSDMNKTPDIRTRATLIQWACEVTLEFVEPNLTPKTVTNLLANAGLIRGVGGWRVGKGSGSCGQFEIVDPKNKQFQLLKRTAGRDAQLRALENPDAIDDSETEELLRWWGEEAERRGRMPVESKPAPKKTKNGASRRKSKGADA